MTAVEKIEALTLGLGLKLASAIVSNPLVEGGYFVPITITREGHVQKPSGRELAKLRDEAAAVGYAIDFLLTDPNTRQIEEGLRASFISSFPDFIRNSFLSIEYGKAIVWIDKKRDLNKDEHVRLESHAKTYVSLFGLREAIVHITSDLNLATNTEILTIIRGLAPASCEAVRDVLLERSFDVPSLDWINRRFDAMRRARLLVREPDRTYILTLEALRRLGTLKNARSPDVSRLLALARRKG
jgi:hypothetical protein